MGKQLRASIVMDYQNVHLTGRDTFGRFRQLPVHQSLVDPLLFARRLLDVRNAAQSGGYDSAMLRHILVFRGQPAQQHDPRGYSRSLAQQAQWSRDPRVAVTLRPLKYDYERDGTGRIATTATGERIVAGKPREKGVDVLCALTAVRECRDPSIDLVILASADSDLAPALDEMLHDGQAKVETFCWWNDRSRHGQQLRPTDRSRRVWNTRLHEKDLAACVDPHPYA